MSLEWAREQKKWRDGREARKTAQQVQVIKSRISKANRDYDSDCIEFGEDISPLVHKELANIGVKLGKRNGKWWQYEFINEAFLQTAEVTEAKQDAPCAADALACVVCLERTKTIVLLPCQHLCLCEQCSSTITKQECPLCKEPVKQTMTVFV